MLHYRSPKSEISVNKIIVEQYSHQETTFIEPPKESRIYCSDFWVYPCKVVKRNFKPGGFIGSVFSLVTCILGAGTVTLPYIAFRTGFVMAIILYFFIAFISYYWGMILVWLADRIRSDKYEDFAEFWYGRNVAILTGWCNIITQLGFLTSFIVFIKTLIPKTLESFIGEDKIPEIFGSGFWTGQIFWATLYTIFLLIPLSLPRKIGALRYNSLFGVLSNFYLVAWIVIMYFTSEEFKPHGQESLPYPKAFDISYRGLLDSIPLVIFAFLFQPNIPRIYRELSVKKYTKMKGVTMLGSVIVILLYTLASTFGYLWVITDKEFVMILDETRNILEVPITNVGFRIGMIALIFSMISIAPTCVLPAKDALEEIIFAENGMGQKHNVVVTVIMCWVCYMLAILIPGIGDVLTVLGWTTTPLIGFILPIIFYLKTEENLKIWQIWVWWGIQIFIIVVSIAGLVNFILDKAHPGETKKL